MEVLDLYCGGGGASMGLKQAGFNWIVGVDNKHQLEYPFEFLFYDVMDLTVDDLVDFDLIWAIPPCQAYSWSSKRTGKDYPDLIEPTRELLRDSGVPYVIENVPNAPIRQDLLLCEEMFKIGVIRHRIFEIEGFHVPQPRHRKHKGKVKNGDYCTVAGHGGNGKNQLKAWQKAIGIDWIHDKNQLAQAVPPVYSRYIGKFFLKQDEIGYNKQECLV